MVKKVTYETVARYFSGNATDAEKLQIESWRDAHPENFAEFNQYRVIWENAGKPEKLFSPNAESALNKVNQALSMVQDISSKGKIVPFIQFARRIAAAVLVGAGLWLAYSLLHKKHEDVMLIANSGIIKKEIVLNDGTHVWLNANSMLRYPKSFSGKIRKVYIEGEAYFDVAKNAKMPFAIETDQSVVRVLGTKFNLRARTNESLTIVTVTEGKVSFSGKDTTRIKPIYLLSGDKGLLNPSKNELVQEKNQDPNTLSWKTGVLVFKKTPLSKVASDISEYFNKNVTIGDSVKGKTPYTATFNKQSLTDILSILEISLGVKVDTTGSNIVLK